MKISSIHIKNLKSITDLQVTFDTNKDICLLYGANGVGKTTLLEAVSLLGHVSSMSRMAISDQQGCVAIKESRFREEYRKKFSEEYEKYQNATAELKSRYRRKNVNVWEKLRVQLNKNVGQRWEEFSPANNVAAIKYDIIFNKKELTIWIYFSQEPGNSITKVLSGEGEFDDLDMDTKFALAYHVDDSEIAQQLVDHFLLMCPHQVNKDDNSKSPHTISRGLLGKSKKAPSLIDSPGIVAYWNTDLNNFGRKNDVRESVKDLGADFFSVMRERLGLDISKAKHDSRKNKARRKELNAALEKALPARSVSGGSRLNAISVSRLYSDKKKTCIEAARPGLSGRSVDFFSAGENEAFTLYLLLIWMPIANSILLFDEPDLHVSTYYGKESFFRELFNLARTEERDCQLIISTHGGFVLPEEFASSTQRLMLRMNIEDSRASFIADWTSQDEIEITSHYLRMATVAFRGTLRSIRTDLAKGMTKRTMIAPLMTDIKRLKAEIVKIDDLLSAQIAQI